VLEKISIIFEPGSDVALAQMVETTYDSNSDQEYFAHLNPKQVKAYNYIALDLATAQNSDIDTIDDFFTLANVAKVTETDYLYDQNYKARNIIGLATETRVMDPANQTGVLNKSQFVYDETAYLDNNYTTAEWEDPNSNFRGEVTTARTWVNESNSWLESHTMYDNFGNVWKVWDTSGDQNRYVETQYSPTSKYAYPTKTISKGPDPTGIHGSNQGSEITRVFDFNTGLLTSVTDANGQTATTEYDGLLRPIRITPPAGGSISETIYNDTPGDTWVKSRQQIDENNWAERTTYFDRVGRAYKTRTRDIQGDVASRVEFDDFGRVARSSNPYRVDAEGNPAEPVYWSKPRYDQLNRVVETFAPATDNQTGISLGTVQFGISTLPNLIGTYVVATDASGRKSRAISGIYGLTRVDEATGKGGTVDQDLGTLANPAQATYYSYNVKGELTKITQGVQNRYFMYDSLGRLIRVRQPEQTPNPNLATSGNPENNQWTAGYSYDAFGHVVRFTDAKGINIINEYDQAGRTTSRCYTKPDIQTTATLCSQLSGAQVSLDTSQVDFYYDGKGLPQIPQFSKGSLTKVTNGVSEHRYLSFDNRGRLLTSQQITDGQTYSFAYKYNLSGGLIEETYPSGRVVKNVLDSDGGLSAVTTRTSTSPFKTIVTNFDYLPTGAVRKMMLGNGRWETAQFNERFQITQLGLGNSPTDTSLWEVDYEYGELSEDGTTIVADRNTGSIARQTTKIPTTSFSQSYRYDSLNRLTEAKETASDGTQNWKQTFGYDRFGNRTSRYQKVGDVVLPIDNYSLPVIDQATNRFTTGQGYEYDFNGNLVQDAEGRTFTFDANDKQIQVTDANQHVVGTYFYDASGARIKKITDTETTVFVYDAGGRLAAEYSTQQNLAPTTSYLTTDHLGSPRAITDKIGNVTSRRDFMPFGEEIYSGIGERSESLNYLSAGSDNVRKRFTGYEKDVETDLDYAQARMYQNSNGRFTAIDPLMASAFALNPQTFNRYTYTGNNPVNHADPSGLLYYRHRETREIRWFDDQPEGDEWEDYTDQRVTIAQGGCFATNRCVIAGDDVTFNQDGSIIYHNRDTSGGIVNIGAEVQETFLEITSQAGELLGTELLSLAPTTGSPSTIDLPTTSPGGGPLEPIGGSESIPGDGTDTGGEIDTGSSGDWKVDAAKLLYFLGQSWWASQGQSDPGDDDEIELYRGIGAPRQGDAPYWQERFRLATLGIAIPVGGHDSPKRHNDGDTDSIFTSWTTDIEVAEGEASYPHPGVVLTKKFPRSRLVASPDEYQESEVLVVGPVTGASVKFLPARR
jgi:RHS repeat-associated protein